MEIRRFGIGQRRPDGPPGTHNVQAAVIEAGSAGLIAELALGRHASIEPHSNPNTAWFIVIEGGGFVTVGPDTARVYAGEAVLWPAGVPHGAGTELSEMRAIVVEFAPDAQTLVLEGGGPLLEAGPGEGHLVDQRPAPYDPRHGEPR
jgi:quercetin dioxygenase-like cupin family protein